MFCEVFIMLSSSMGCFEVAVCSSTSYKARSDWERYVLISSAQAWKPSRSSRPPSKVEGWMPRWFSTLFKLDVWQLLFHKKLRRKPRVITRRCINRSSATMLSKSAANSFVLSQGSHGGSRCASWCLSTFSFSFRSFASLLASDVVDILFDVADGLTLEVHVVVGEEVLTIWRTSGQVWCGQTWSSSCCCIGQRRLFVTVLALRASSMTGCIISYAETSCIRSWNFCCCDFSVYRGCRCTMLCSKVYSCTRAPAAYWCRSCQYICQPMLVRCSRRGRLFGSLLSLVLCIVRYPRSSPARRTAVVVMSYSPCCSLRLFRIWSTRSLLMTAASLRCFPGGSASSFWRSWCACERFFSMNWLMLR